MIGHLKPLSSTGKIAVCNRFHKYWINSSLIFTYSSHYRKKKNLVSIIFLLAMWITTYCFPLFSFIDNFEYRLVQCFYNSLWNPAFEIRKYLLLCTWSNNYTFQSTDSAPKRTDQGEEQQQQENYPPRKSIIFL